MIYRKSRKLVPKFLLKIYQRLSEDDDEQLHLKQNRLNDENDGFTDEHARIIEMSDTIMTFVNNRKYIDIQGKELKTRKKMFLFMNSKKINAHHQSFRKCIFKSKKRNAHIV